MTENIKKILVAYFDMHTIIKGTNYYNNGNVVKTNFKNGQLSATVMGHGNKTYHLSIMIENQKILKTYCSCPVGIYCKHSVAALITHFLEYKPEPIKNPLTIKNYKESSLLYEISSPTQEMKNQQFAYTMDTVLSLIEKNSSISKDEIWNPVLVLENYEYSSYRTIPDLTLKMQIIKKNGTPGRIQNYNELKVQPVNNDNPSKPIIEFLANTHNKRVNLSILIDHILKNNIEILGKDHSRITLTEMPHLEIYYKYHDHFLNEKATIGFKPVIKNTNKKPDQENSEIAEYFDPSIRISTNNFFAFIISNTIKYIHIDGKPMSYFLENAIFNNPYSFKDDINSIITTAEKHFSHKIKIYNNYTRLEYRKIKPEVELVLDEQFENNTTLSYRFIYSGKTKIKTIQDPSNIIIDDNYQSNTIVVAKTDISFENSVIDYIESIIDENEKSPYRHNYSYGIKYNEKSTDLQIGISDFIGKYGERILDEGYKISFGQIGKIKKIIRTNSVKVKLNDKIDWFDAEIYAEDKNGDMILLNDFVKNVKSKTISTGDSIIILTPENRQLLDKIIADLDKNLRISQYDLSLIDKMYEAILTPDKKIVQKKELIDKIKNFKTQEETALPKGLNATLREYQKSGYQWLYLLYKNGLNGILADDMGLGKTVQTLALIQKIKEENKENKKKEPILIVAPVTVMSNWKNEIEKFTPEIKVTVHSGPGRNKNISESIGNFDIIITSYHTLRNDIEAFCQLKFKMLILDEAQSIKNHSSLAFKAVNLIDAEHKLSLTGTPIENRTGELWSQFNFLLPGLLGDAASFRKNYSTPIENYKDHDAAAKLKDKVFPFILRRKKSEVLDDLPPKEEIIVECEMDTRQSLLYNKIRLEQIDKLKDFVKQKGLAKSSMIIIEALLKLRQIAVMPSLVDTNFTPIDSCKFEMFKDLIDEMIDEGNKVVIFSQFLGVLSEVRSYIESKSIRYSYIDGSTDNRQQEIDNFQNIPEVQVFMLSIKAGGVGINLTRAEYVILLDPWWNPAVEQQAVDRVHRIGQQNKVIVYKLVTKDTVEEKILQMQKTKKDLADNIIAEDTKFFKDLSLSDMINLF